MRKAASLRYAQRSSTDLGFHRNGIEAVARSRVSPRGAALAPEAALQRAERLGHRIGPQHLAAPSVPGLQRFFEKDDLPLAQNVPAGAKISENLNLVAAGKQTVYASDDKIRDANRILAQGSKIVLTAGEKRDFNLALPPDQTGFSTVSLADHYRVIPRYNPGALDDGSDLPRSFSAEQGETRVETERKHVAYEKELADLGTDYSQFMEEVQAGVKEKGYAESFGGPAALDPTEWYQQVNLWTAANGVRRLALKLGLNEIAGAYMLDNDTGRRAASLRQLGTALATFIERELSQPDRIALPTDCGQLVTYIAHGGQAVQNDRLDDNPDIGSNYYTALPKNVAGVGWKYHWAGVILKDGGDNVTLESAGGTSLGSIGKDSWWMEMYGTQRVNQTFKRRLHQLHIIRNRSMLAGQEESTSRTRALQQLTEHQQVVNSWNRLDSDQG